MFPTKRICSEFISQHSLDARNPAPAGMYKTWQILWYLPYQLVQKFLPSTVSWPSCCLGHATRKLLWIAPGNACYVRGAVSKSSTSISSNHWRVGIFCGKNWCFPMILTSLGPWFEFFRWKTCWKWNSGSTLKGNAETLWRWTQNWHPMTSLNGCEPGN